MAKDRLRRRLDRYAPPRAVQPFDEMSDDKERLIDLDRIAPKWREGEIDNKQWQKVFDLLDVDNVRDAEEELDRLRKVNPAGGRSERDDQSVRASLAGSRPPAAGDLQGEQPDAEGGQDDVLMRPPNYELPDPPDEEARPDDDGEEEAAPGDPGFPDDPAEVESQLRERFKQRELIDAHAFLNELAPPPPAANEASPSRNTGQQSPGTALPQEKETDVFPRRPGDWKRSLKMPSYAEYARELWSRGDKSSGDEVVKPPTDEEKALADQAEENNLRHTIIYNTLFDQVQEEFERRFGRRMTTADAAAAHRALVKRMAREGMAVRIDPFTQENRAQPTPPGELPVPQLIADKKDRYEPPGPPPPKSPIAPAVPPAGVKAQPFPPPAIPGRPRTPPASGETIRSHAVVVDGKVYEGDSHQAAYENAVKAGATGDVKKNLFVTTTGRLVNQAEALSLPAVREALGLSGTSNRLQDDARKGLDPMHGATPDNYLLAARLLQQAGGNHEKAMEFFLMRMAGSSSEQKQQVLGLLGLGKPLPFVNLARGTKIADEALQDAAGDKKTARSLIERNILGASKETRFETKEQLDKTAPTEGEERQARALGLSVYEMNRLPSMAQISEQRKALGVSRDELFRRAGVPSGMVNEDINVGVAKRHSLNEALKQLKAERAEALAKIPKFAKAPAFDVIERTRRQLNLSLDELLLRAGVPSSSYRQAYSQRGSAGDSYADMREKVGDALRAIIVEMRDGK